MQMRDLPLEQCLAVRSTTSLARVAELAAEAGARYVLVRELTGDVKGVQLTWPKELTSFDPLFALLEAIHSDDPSALVGLPLIRTSRMLRAAGIKLL